MQGRGYGKQWGWAHREAMEHKYCENTQKKKTWQIDISRQVSNVYWHLLLFIHIWSWKLHWIHFYFYCPKMTCMYMTDSMKLWQDMLVYKHATLSICSVYWNNACSLLALCICTLKHTSAVQFVTNIKYLLPVTQLSALCCIIRGDCRLKSKTIYTQSKNN